MPGILAPNRWKWTLPQERQVAFYFHKMLTALPLFTGVIHCGFTEAGYSTTTIFVNPVSLLNKMSEAHDLSVQLCTDVQT